MKFFFGIGVVLISLAALAEPWVSNRYAQNCAGCHAPGRLNLPPVDRRCTLSCQGCHVNPNGGGLRNQYGIWNQQRWLRSYKNKKLFGHKSTPKPHNKQPYMKTKRNKKGYYPVKNFVTTSRVGVKDYKYTNKVYKDWHKQAKNKRHFLSRVPNGDPYRLERNFETTFGGDLRLMYLTKNSGVDNSESVFFPMSLDLGARIRPTREKYSAVVEVRFANPPSNTELEDLFETSAFVRSAYLMADDLWYNTYAMAGLFRPMFGNYNSDHLSLSNLITGLGYSAVFKGIGVGTAPNVPFANVNLIQPMSNTNYAQDEGVVANFGGRFVTYSLSALLSYWSTKKPVLPAGNVAKTDLTAIALGAKWKNFIFNFEAVLYEFQEIILGSLVRNSGNVLTSENKYRFWRENYLVLNYATSNTAIDHTKGNATQVMGGVKSYLYPGTEVELLFVNETEDDGGVKTTDSRTQLQLHLSF